jgi:hypothetical protein
MVRLVIINQHIRQYHGKRLITHGWAGAANGVAKALGRTCSRVTSAGQMDCTSSNSWRVPASFTI